MSTGICLKLFKILYFILKYNLDLLNKKHKSLPVECRGSNIYLSYFKLESFLLEGRRGEGYMQWCSALTLGSAVRDHFLEGSGDYTGCWRLNPGLSCSKQPHDVCCFLALTQIWIFFFLFGYRYHQKGREGEN